MGLACRGESHLDVSVCYLIIVQVLEPLQDLFCIEADGGLVILEWTPLGPQQSGETTCNTRQTGQDFSLIDFTNWKVSEYALSLGILKCV